MTEMYRLRSVNNLLGSCQELEQQSIYFASPEQLNDPMEGFRDLVWQGDRIVWTNLFRHYLYCLHTTYTIIQFVGDAEKVESRDIPIKGYMDQQLPPKTIDLFEDVCRRVFEKANFHNLIAKIVDVKRKTRRDEILVYLQILHFAALSEVQNVYIEHGLAPESTRLKQAPSTLFKTFPKILDLLQPAAQQIGDEKFPDSVFTIQSQIMTELCILHKYSAGSESKGMFEGNRRLLIYDFPGAYLKQLEQLLYPEWYVACFMRDYRNSSAWGHYGDNHKGVCLIFEVEQMTTGRNSLTLNCITGYSSSTGEIWRPSPLHFYDVKYGDKAGEVDLFRSIGWLSQAKLTEDWYRDKDGNMSECGVHLETNNIESWRENYWDNFYPAITSKIRDWEYEQESRLILFSLLGDLSDPRRRTLTYDFSSLKGIIFGIATSDSDKLKIMRIIDKKCQENNRTDFEFFQAYYCHDTGEIKKYKLHFHWSGSSPIPS